MNLATLGCDETLLEIARWVRQSSEHTIGVIYEPGDGRDELQQLFPAAKLYEGLDSLVLAPDAEAIIVSGRTAATDGSQLRIDQFRTLVQSDIPMVIVHPACESIEAIEYEMIRNDTQCVMTSHMPAYDHPAYRELCRRIDEGKLGDVEQVVFERWANERTKRSMLDAITRDVVLIRGIIGDIREVGAMGGMRDEPDYSNLAVNMSSRNSKLARWSVARVDEFEGARITVLGSSGKASLVMPDHSMDFDLQIDGDDVELEAWSNDDAIQQTFRRMQHQTELADGSSDWELTCHALEVGDCVEQSCRRRRTIDVLGEQPTEEDTFKAMMTAGGCAMLMWVLMLIPFGLAVPKGLFRAIWLAFLILPLLLFLSLQLFKFVFRVQKKK